jgi:hypothetical protein
VSNWFPDIVWSIAHIDLFRKCYQNHNHIIIELRESWLA